MKTTFDVTIYKLSSGRWSYMLYTCVRPMQGVQKTHLGAYEVEYSHAVIWWDDSFKWKVKLLPSESLATKYSNIAKKHSNKVYMLKILPDEY